MPRRSFQEKPSRVGAPTVPLSYRLDRTNHERLVAQAKASGMSVGGFAREALLQKLVQAEEEAKGIGTLFTEVQTLRRELALATRAILTVSGAPVTPEQAAEWVRKNLNR